MILQLRLGANESSLRAPTHELVHGVCEGVFDLIDLTRRQLHSPHDLNNFIES